jgi:glutathione synthase/RimK-type ligase-like ATP-grasp enzyme
VTARVARGLDDDLEPLAAALREAGADVSIPDWDDSGVDWSAFDRIVLRSPWDYTTRLPEFLAWAARAAKGAALINPLSVIRWNTDKHYLADLAGAGVPPVPSAFIEVGGAAAGGVDAFLAMHATPELVVKPSVGAGSRDAQRYGREDRAAAIAHVERLLAERRSVLLQPYLDRVDEAGETALLFFGGTFSHAVRKGPLLRRGEAPTRALFAPEHITPRVPDAGERRVAEQAVAAVPFGVPAYARVDLIRDADGNPCVLELELTEPSVFFKHGPGSAARFASVILAGL